MRLRAFFLILVALGLCGCRAHMIHVTLVNASSQPISTIVVDYPGATFGVNDLAPGQTFAYTIKPLETGAIKVQFADAQGKSHNSTLDTVHKGDEGSLEVRFSQDRAVSHLTPRQ